MTSEQDDILWKAEATLSPMYEEGDDGDHVRQALDALAGLLADKRGIALSGREDLRRALELTGADKALIQEVEELYRTAARGEYGAGLTGRAANRLNDLLDDAIDSLVGFVRQELEGQEESPQ